MIDNSDNAAQILLADFESAAAVRLDPPEEVRRKRIDRYRTLWIHRGFLIRVAVVAFVLSATAAVTIPNQYESTTTLVPPDETNPNISMVAAAAKGGINVGGIAEGLFGLRNNSVLLVGLLESRTVLDDLINKFDLRAVYKHSKWVDARKQLASRTEITEDHKNGIILITVTDKDPQRAAAMAQEYVDELNHIVNVLSISSARRERVFLEGRLAQVDQELETAEKSFSQFASKNTAIDIKEQSRATIDAAAALQGQMIAAQTELEGMRQTYTNDNVRVREAQARVNELQRELQKLGGKATNSAGADANTESMYPSLNQLPLLGVTYADLYREMKVKEMVFEALTQQYELAKVEEAKEIPSVCVLDAPDVPERKSAPHRLWTTLGGTALGSLFGCLWILGGERWRQLDPRDPGKVLMVEVLHAIQIKLPLPSRGASAMAPHDKRDHSSSGTGANGRKS